MTLKSEKDSLRANLKSHQSEAMMSSHEGKDSSKELKIALNLEAFKTKTKDGRRAFARLNRHKNPELDIIMKDLVVLETQLRQEQSKILSLLVHKDVTINDQQQEIEKLRRDNERLIQRIKKITGGGQTKKDEITQDLDQEKIVPWAVRQHPSSVRSSEINKPSNNTVFSLLTSQFYEKTSLQFTDHNGQLTERVLHKPPIAKKPKFASGFATLNRPITAIVRQKNGQCSIVSTISRLLEEESDQGLTESSSEPSSPDATLKPSSSHPRVLKLAHQFEKGLISSDSLGRDSIGSGRDHSSKTMLILDEHEVTSGYNSDAISDQDPDYENVIVVRERTPSDALSGLDTEEESDDNYVILRASHGQLLESGILEDIHTYSNVEYSNGEGAECSDEVFEKDRLDSTSSETRLSSDSMATYLNESDLKNVPRSRHNINLIMDSGSHGGESRLMDNFEEFSLDSLDMEDNNSETDLSTELRLSGDGAEAKNTLIFKEQGESKGSQGACGYEKFLEVTGLSQKSILTPTRMFSNHRSVLKPRDIKHRDKLRAVFTSLSVVDENAPTSSFTSNSSAQRYWREPYCV